jgi:hypothetical protein
MHLRAAYLLSVFALAALPSLAAPTTFPASPPNPQGLGVNIHFTDPRPGELEMLAAAGFTWVRMDLGWGGMERRKGEYDFTAYDRLTAALDQHRLKALFILDYTNRLYDEGQPPHTDEARATFARWAVAVAHHFKGRGYLWEMWNEPNIAQFWKPKPNADDYARLAVAVGKALRDAEPDETYIGPATSTVDLKFIEACCKAGCLEYWSAVSVHPYRQSAPETAAKDYRELRALVDRYSRKRLADREIPIISGEWGYSAGWKKFDADKQGRYLPRQLLFNRWYERPLSIWYDWHDDGVDPNEPEHHFGTVLNPYRQGDAQVYEPKPAYLAMKTLSEQLKGYHFNKRILLDNADNTDDYVMLFNRDEDCRDVRLAAWTIHPEGHQLTMPASPGKVAVTTHLGERSEIDAGPQGLRLNLTDAPQYVAPIKENAILAKLADWNSLPPVIVDVAAQGEVNAFDNTFRSFFRANPNGHRADYDIILLYAPAGTPAKRITVVFPRTEDAAVVAYQETWVMPLKP